MKRLSRRSALLYWTAGSLLGWWLVLAAASLLFG